MKKNIFSVRTLLFCLMFYLIVCWKTPFYIMLLGVELPEDSIVLKRQVSVGDACYWKILAEVAFVNNQDGNLWEPIWTENRNLMEKRVDSTKWSLMNAPAVYETCCGSSLSVSEMDALASNQKWYSLVFSMHGKALRTFVFLRITLFFLTLAALIGMTCYDARKKKKDAC